MNLHGIASPAIAAVNPLRPITVQVSTGYVTGPSGKPVPTYTDPITGVRAQIQPATFRDLQQTEGLNLQGTRKSIYITGNIDGIVRPDNKGGDLVTFEDDGTVWLVAMVLEAWPDWCKVAATLQNGS
jgi:hypothetical protein